MFIGVIIAIFALVSVFMIYHGTAMCKFGKQFEKEADEARAMVTNCERHVETHTDSDGDTTTEVTYYV